MRRWLRDSPWAIFFAERLGGVADGWFLFPMTSAGILRALDVVRWLLVVVCDGGEVAKMADLCNVRRRRE